MTEASAPNTPRTPREVSSNRLLRTTLLWSAIVTAGLAVVGAIVGFAVAVALLLVVVLRCLPVLRATHQPLIPAVKRCLVSNRSH